MSNLYIDPYSQRVGKIESPDGKYFTQFSNLEEFRMSGPVVGELNLSTGVKIVNVGVSICWSKESEFLAFTELNHETPEFKLKVINILTGIIRTAPGSFGPIGIKGVSKKNIIICLEDKTESNVNISRIKW